MPVRIEGESIENIYSSEDSTELSPKKVFSSISTGSRMQNTLGSNFKNKMDGPIKKNSNNVLSIALQKNLEKKTKGKLDPIEAL